MRYISLLLIIGTLGACAMTRAPSLNMLENRADYGNISEIKEALDEVDHPLLVPIRTKPIIADIWVHPHELANGDYFRGGWIRTVVTRSHWQVEEKLKPLVIKPQPQQKVKNKVRKIK